MQNLAINSNHLPLTHNCPGCAHSMPYGIKLHDAVWKRDVQAVRTVINEGADVKERWSRNNYAFPTALHIAAEHSTAEIARMLIDAGAEVDAIEYNFKTTPLLKAVLHNNKEVLKVLIEAGANLYRNDAFHCSVASPFDLLFNEDRETIKILVEGGLHINVRDREGKTLLQKAVEKDDVSLVKFLISLGADVNAVPLHGMHASGLLDQSLLHLAVAKGSNLEMVEILLKNGANMTGRDKNGRTVLDYSQKSKEINSLLLNYGDDTEVRSSFDQAPLMNALAYKNADNLKKFIDSGFDPNAYIPGTNLTPLTVTCASSCKNIDIIKLLLELGADINALDSRGRSPLISAVKYRQGLFGKAYEVTMRDLKESLNFLLEYSDANLITTLGHNVFSVCFDEDFLIVILEHLAKMQVLDLLDPVILQTISESNKYKEILAIREMMNLRDPFVSQTSSTPDEYYDYFQKCTKELIMAKETKLRNSWVSFFNLLVDNPKKLKNYATNKDLVEDFQNTDCLKKFPIYGASLKENMKNGIKRQGLYDKSCDLLDACLMVFNPTHLVVRDILDCIDDKDLSTFCKKN